MPVITLRPNGDGTITGWSPFNAPTAWEAIDDDPDAHDGDSTIFSAPNVADGQAWVLLQDVPADFNPDGINSITIKVAAKFLNTPAMAVDLIDLYFQIERSDESTDITTESAVCNVTDTANYVLFSRTVTVSGSHSVADWNGARLKFRQDHTSQQTVDSVARARITAAEVVIDYTAAAARIPARGRATHNDGIAPAPGRTARPSLLRPGDSRPVQPARRQSYPHPLEVVAMASAPVLRPPLLRPDGVAPPAGGNLPARVITAEALPLISEALAARRPLLRPGDSRPVQPRIRFAGQDPAEVQAINPLPVQRPPLLRPGDSRPVQPRIRFAVQDPLEVVAVAAAPVLRPPLLRADGVAPPSGGNLPPRVSTAHEVPLVLSQPAARRSLLRPGDSRPDPPAPRLSRQDSAELQAIVPLPVHRPPLVRPGDSRPVQPARRFAQQNPAELLAIVPLPVRRPSLLRPDPAPPITGALGTRRLTLAELPLWDLGRGRTFRPALLRPDIEVCLPTNATLLPALALVESRAAVGGVEIARMDATAADEVLVQFRSAHAGWFHQLYLGRTLVDRTWLPEQRTLVAKISGSDWPEPLQVLAVHPDVADQDFGDKLPPRPYNRVRLKWRASSFPADAAFLDVTAGNAPLADVDPDNRLNRILYNGDIDYEYLTDPLAGSGYWNFEITPRDNRDPDGNAGAPACARERVLAYPPDVDPQSATSRFGLSLAGGIATFTATLPD